MNDINNQIFIFKKEIEKKYDKNIKNIIYLRLSKIDNSLSEKEQIKDTMNKLKSDFDLILTKYSYLEKEGFMIFIEVKSAYKNSAREEFNNICEKFLFENILISDFFTNKLRKKKINLFISSFDRISRIFLDSLFFQLIRKFLDIKIYSLIEEEIKHEEKYKEILNKSNMEQIIYIFELMLMSNNASKHSEEMSNKIKKRVIKFKNKTISSKTGKKWGREQTINKQMKIKILERLKKFTAKEVSEQKDIFQIINNKKSPISIHTINKIKILEKKRED